MEKTEEEIRKRKYIATVEDMLARRGITNRIGTFIWLRDQKIQKELANATRAEQARMEINALDMLILKEEEAV